MSTNNLPKSPFEILDPDKRWKPSNPDHHPHPPLVPILRQKVKDWRDKDYQGISKTTEALLEWWFKKQHIQTDDDTLFQYYFCQREAIETLIYLYEIEKVRTPEFLISFDSSGELTEDHFKEHWLRFVIKMATGSGKTKTMGLALVWSYFNRIYEDNTDFSKNFLIIAPNIIVLDRLRKDFEHLQMFKDDPILPDNFHYNKNWKDDFFNISVHIQDHIKPIKKEGNIFLTNIQRVYERNKPPSLQDEDKTSYFLGKKPVSDLQDSGVKVEDIVRDIDELAVFNDEAHHIHDPKLAWFKAIEDIHNNLKQKGGKLTFQVDTTATPKDSRGNVFVQTIVDYPLVEAIYQKIVKLPIIPDDASRGKLEEKQSSKFSEKYQDYIKLGFIEWEKIYKEYKSVEKKAVLFIMVDDTRNCDDVAAYLERTYPLLKDKVFTIHTNKSGDFNETSKKDEKELSKLRELANTIDNFDNDYLVVVSVMMLKEGWDVKNVTTIVGLRPYTATAKILPEQTLGRGLRKMQGIEKQELSVVGTDAFINFVKEIKKDGVDLEEKEMGKSSPPRVPEIVKIDKEDETLNLEMDIFKSFYFRDQLEASRLNPALFEFEKLKYKNYEQNEIVRIYFRDIIDNEVKSIVEMTIDNIDWRHTVGWFSETIVQELRMAIQPAKLFPKIKDFIENHLFDRKVSVEDPNTMANIKTPETVNRIKDTFRKEIHKLTIKENKGIEKEGSLFFKSINPFVPESEHTGISFKKDNIFYNPKKTLFNKVVLDSPLEYNFVKILEDCTDIISYIRNYAKKRDFFSVSYINKEGRIADFWPDFIVKANEQNYYIVETKGFPDVNIDKKMQALKEWCKKANSSNECEKNYKFLFIDQNTFNKIKPQSFSELIRNFTEYQ